LPQVSNPFFFSYSIERKKVHFYSATPLTHSNRCLFQNPLLEVVRSATLSAVWGGFPSRFFMMDPLTILHTAGEHH
jgi:hypothetical protein